MSDNSGNFKAFCRSEMPNFDFSFEKIYPILPRSVASRAILRHVDFRFRLQSATSRITTCDLTWRMSSIIDWLFTIVHFKMRGRRLQFRRGIEIAFRSAGLREWTFPLASSRVIPHKGKWSVYPRDYERTTPLLNQAVHLFRTLISFSLFSRDPPFFAISRGFGTRWTSQYYNHCKDKLDVTVAFFTLLCLF